VYPEEIEGYFADSSVIGEIVVIGVPRNNREEEIVAVIHPNCEYLQETLPHELLTVEHIHDLVEAEVREANKRLPGYKKISRFEIREFEFEKTSSKKIKRNLYTTLEECLHR